MFQLSADVKLPSYFAQRSKRHDIVDPVHETDAALDLGYFVVVIPELVGPDELFVDERMSLADVLQLTEPSLFSEDRNPNAILDQQAVIHRLGDIGDDLEAHIRWRDGIEIRWRADEVPGSGQVGRNNLLAVECVDFRHFRVSP